MAKLLSAVSTQHLCDSPIIQSVGKIAVHGTSSEFEPVQNLELIYPEVVQC